MAINKKWATNGIKTTIPQMPQGDNLVNYDEGFTNPYQTPVRDGGEAITLGTFNQLMYDITDEIIENKATLNQVSQQISGLINDAETGLTTTWSSDFINSKLTSLAGSVIDDTQIATNLTWSSSKISNELNSLAEINDDELSNAKTWSSEKINEVAKARGIISVGDFTSQEITENTTLTNSDAKAKILYLDLEVRTTKGNQNRINTYLGDIIVCYNNNSNEILHQSCISEYISGGATIDIIQAVGGIILDTHDTIIIKASQNSVWSDARITIKMADISGSN